MIFVQLVISTTKKLHQEWGHLPKERDKILDLRERHIQFIHLLFQENIKMIFIETPCNPLTTLTSVKEMVKLKNKISDETGNKVVLTVDNTFCGPVYLKPIELGADLVVYSLTKFIGGHSDLVAGSVSGSIAEVASSKIKICGSKTNARTKEMSWRCPIDKLAPRSITW